MVFSKANIIVILLGINIALWVVFLLNENTEDVVQLGIAVLMVILALLGVAGIAKDINYFVYMYGIASFIPVGFYLLFNPSIYSVIGLINIFVPIIFYIHDRRFLG